MTRVRSLPLVARPPHAPRFPLLPALCALCVGILAGCSGPEPSAPRFVHPPRAPVRNISDGAHAGNSHFFFLPPMVASPAYHGGSDGSLKPSVTVCDIGTAVPQSGSACLGPAVAQFTATSGTGSQVVRYDASAQQYIVNWNLDLSTPTLQAGHYYRVTVAVAGTSLGFADVVPVQGGSNLKNYTTGDVIPLVNGRTLPVKFRIEQGAIAVLTRAGGTATLAGGAVRLDVPAGAVSRDVGITAEAVQASPGPSDAKYGATGTTYSFGPDGAQFAKPVSLTIKYDPALVPPGRPESSLRLHTLVNGRWVLVPGSVVDPATHTVTGATTHFSVYAVRSMHRLLMSTYQHVFTVYEDGSGPTVLDIQGGFPRWSPSGDRIAYVEASRISGSVRIADSNGHHVGVGGVGTNELGVENVADLEWSPDQTKLLVKYHSFIYYIPIDRHVDQIPDPEIYVPTGYPGHVPRSAGATWSANGQQILFLKTLTDSPTGGDVDWDVFSANVDGSSLARVTVSPDRFEAFGAWSADRSKLLMWTWKAASPNSEDIVVLNAASGIETSILTNVDITATYDAPLYPHYSQWQGIYELWPTWMPGENRIMFHSLVDLNNTEINSQFIAVDLNGNNPVLIYDMRMLRAAFPWLAPDEMLVGPASWEP